MQEITLKYVGEKYVGHLEDYYFSIIPIQGNYNGQGALFVFPNEVSKEMRKTVQKQLKTPVLFKKHKIKNDALLIYLPMKLFSNKDKYEEKVNSIITQAVATFKTNLLRQTQNCDICKAPFESEEEKMFHVWQDSYVPSHEACLGREINKVKESIRLEDTRSNYLIVSIIFSMIGAVIGIIPMVLGVFYMDTYYALFYALIPVGAFYGYKLGKAPMKNYMLYLIIIISVIVVVVFQFLYWSIIAMSFDLTLAQVLRSVDGRNGFLRDLMISLVFLGIGIYLSWRYISNTNANKLKQIHSVKKDS